MPSSGVVFKNEPSRVISLHRVEWIMGILRPKNSIDTMITSNRIVVFNWTTNGCAPCKDQERTIRSITDNLDSPQITVFNLEYDKHRKAFKKLGNKAVPSINVFVDSTPVQFVDTKINPRKKVGLWKSSKIVGKNVTAITGRRPDEDLVKIFKESLEMIIK